MALKDFIGGWTVTSFSSTDNDAVPGESINITDNSSEVVIDSVSGTGQISTALGNYHEGTDSIQESDPDSGETYISRYQNAEDVSFRRIYGLTIRGGDVTVWGAAPQDSPPMNPSRNPVAPSPFDGAYTVQVGSDFAFLAGVKLTISVDATQLAIQLRPSDPEAPTEFGLPLKVDRLTDSVEYDADDGLLRVWSYADRGEDKKNYLYGLTIPVGPDLPDPEQGGACAAEEEEPPPPPLETDR